LLWGTNFGPGNNFVLLERTKHSPQALSSWPICRRRSISSNPFLHTHFFYELGGMPTLVCFCCCPLLPFAGTSSAWPSACSLTDSCLLLVALRSAGLGVHKRIPVVDFKGHLFLARQLQSKLPFDGHSRIGFYFGNGTFQELNWVVGPIVDEASHQSLNGKKMNGIAF